MADEVINEQWCDVDIADQILMPAGVIVEKRTKDGKTQYRNPFMVSICNSVLINWKIDG